MAVVEIAVAEGHAAAGAGVADGDVLHGGGAQGDAHGAGTGHGAGGAGGSGAVGREAQGRGGGGAAAGNKGQAADAGLAAAGIDIAAGRVGGGHHVAAAAHAVVGVEVAAGDAGELHVAEGAVGVQAAPPGAEITGAEDQVLPLVARQAEAGSAGGAGPHGDVQGAVIGLTCVIRSGEAEGRRGAGADGTGGGGEIQVGEVVAAGVGTTSGAQRAVGVGGCAETDGPQIAVVVAGAIVVIIADIVADLVNNRGAGAAVGAVEIIGFALVHGRGDGEAGGGVVVVAVNTPISRTGIAQGNNRNGLIATIGKGRRSVDSQVAVIGAGVVIHITSINGGSAGLVGTSSRRGIQAVAPQRSTAQRPTVGDSYVIPLGSGRIVATENSSTCAILDGRNNRESLGIVIVIGIIPAVRIIVRIIAVSIIVANIYQTTKAGGSTGGVQCKGVSIGSGVGGSCCEGPVFSSAGTILIQCSSNSRRANCAPNISTCYTRCAAHCKRTGI